MLKFNQTPTDKWGKENGCVIMHLSKFSFGEQCVLIHLGGIKIPVDIKKFQFTKF